MLHSRSEDVSSIQLRQFYTFNTLTSAKTADYDVDVKKSAFKGLQTGFGDGQKHR